jgi:hypothetical protein
MDSDRFAEHLQEAENGPHGVTVTYTPPGGTAQTGVTGVWLPEGPSDEEQDRDGLRTVRRATLTVRADVVAAPVAEATVTDEDGEVWSVTGVEPRPHGHRLALHRYAGRERTTEGFRRAL